MISISNIHKSYRLGSVEVHALRGVSLAIDRGEFVAIMGPSGSGKSTLMHILGLLDTPDVGTFEFEGRDISRLDDRGLSELRGKSIGFVFQQFNLLPRVSALENVTLPLIYSDAPDPVSPAELLEKVGLGDRKKHAPNELSGGQQQRVAIARALVNRPVVLMADEPTGNLDSKSSAEIMAILRELNQAGLTVIVVTHDPEVASNARRTITIRDGVIVHDTRPAADRRVKTAETRPSGDAGLRPGRRASEAVAMLRQAGRSLWAKKTRTFLSMLGVLIGVASVISMLALGSGAKKAVQDAISSMGANLLVIRPGGSQSRGVNLGAGAMSRLTLDDADALPGMISAVTRAVPTVQGPAQLSFENKNWRTRLLGTAPAYLELHSLKVASGRFFNGDEVAARARVAVIGTTVSKELFGESNPIGRTIRINRGAFEVIGLLADMGSSFHFDQNDQVMMPVTTAMRRVLGKSYVDNIEMQVESADLLDYTELAAIDLMAQRHRITRNADDAFSVRNMADIQSAIASTSRTIAILLAVIGTISLIVGGIGIMNIMLVSVTERTREIGIRKAVGAKRSDILMQFLVESAAISSLGGVVGILIGIGITRAMSHFAGWTVVISPLTILMAFAFSAAVGIVFGLWPAAKASRLHPIDALRYE